MDLTIYALFYFILFGAIGILIGQKKGRALAGLAWSMLLGPFGWLLVLLGPDLNSPKGAPCPHCAGVVPINQAKCNHCGNVVRWLRGKAFKPSRAA